MALEDIKFFSNSMQVLGMLSLLL